MSENPQPKQSWWSHLSSTTKKVVSGLVALATILSAYFGYLAVKDQFKGPATNQSQENEQLEPFNVMENVLTEPDPPVQNQQTPQPIDNRQQADQTDPVREPVREPPARDEPQAEPPPPSPPPPPNLSRNCPAQSIVLHFQKPGNVGGRFHAIVDGTQIRMINCESNGFFSTRFSADRGSIDGSGRWSSDRIQFDFGHHVSFAGVHPIRCSVSGRGNGDRSYIGNLTCYDDDDDTLSVGNVEIEF